MWLEPRRCSDAVGKQPVALLWALSFLWSLRLALEENQGHPHSQDTTCGYKQEATENSLIYFLWTTSVSGRAEGSRVGGWCGGTWDCSPVGAWVRLDDRVQAAGPDTGTQTCYCPWAFKHRLVWSGRRQRAQMKANIINIKGGNDYLQQKMSPRPL